ncbi:hypothetical protein HmCmsJML035_04008 [Escherichia coli]|nr:hypothetical protein HmCmsJML035_04008 [Escherichia coli]SVW24941.1 Uncharacterised protein [Klebsiella pneumoniae]
MIARLYIFNVAAHFRNARCNFMTGDDRRFGKRMTAFQNMQIRTAYPVEHGRNPYFVRFKLLVWYFNILSGDFPNI